MYSILLIQEHWLYEFEFNILNEILTNCSYHALSSMKSDELRRGRGYGGTGILWKQNVNASIMPIMTSSTRRCVVKYEHQSCNILIMSVYMPVNTNEFRDEFNNVLDEIDSLCLQYSDYDLIIGGDFNCDFARGDERSEVLSAWVRNRELSCPALQPHAPR